MWYNPFLFAVIFSAVQLFYSRIPDEELGHVRELVVNVEEVQPLVTIILRQVRSLGTTEVTGIDLGCPVFEMYHNLGIPGSEWVFSAALYSYFDCLWHS